MTVNEHHEVLSRFAEVGIVVGNRVKLTQDIDRYPFCIIKRGECGTIEDVSNGFVSVKLDTYHCELDEWDNELHFNYDQIPEEIEELTSLFVLPEMPEVG